MTKKPFVLGLASLLAFALLAVSRTDTAVEANHIPNTSDGIGIDADTTGNTPTSLGTREDCVTANAGDDVIVDVTIEGVPVYNDLGDPGPTPEDSGGIVGAIYNLVYPLGVLSIAADDVNQMLAAEPGSLVVQFGDPMPDTDGQFNGYPNDLSAIPESGDGVLDRLTVHIDAGAAAGTYGLHLFDASHFDVQGAYRLAAASLSAQIAVGVACTTAPPPAPILMGDVDCDNTVNAVDALKVLRFSASLSVAQAALCTDIGISTTINSPGPLVHVGDVDCSGTVNAVDALKVLRKAASLSVAQTEPCDDIGT